MCPMHVMAIEESHFCPVALVHLLCPVDEAVDATWAYSAMYAATALCIMQSNACSQDGIR